MTVPPSVPPSEAAASGYPSVPEPRDQTGDAARLFAAYLDWYRAAVLHKVAVLDEAERRTSRLPRSVTSCRFPRFWPDSRTSSLPRPKRRPGTEGW